jgi:hypothetical protein
MTEHDIQNSLYRYSSSKNHVSIVPNTFAYSWESDMLSFTRSNFVHEYEIKISLSDFKADFRKAEKHEVLKIGSRTPREYELSWVENPAYASKVKYNPTTKQILELRPNYFWYICPCDIIPLDEIPEYAGLMYLGLGNYPKIIKDAPRLHSDKVPDKIKQHVVESFTFKYWKLRFKTIANTVDIIDSGSEGIANASVGVS